VEIRLYDPSEDTLDGLEDAIVDYVNEQSTDMPAKLTDASTVKTIHFAFREATQDARDAFQAARFTVLTRVLTFDVVFVKRARAWAS
jgi:hypothetical protein